MRKLGLVVLLAACGGPDMTTTQGIPVYLDEGPYGYEPSKDLYSCIFDVVIPLATTYFPYTEREILRAVRGGGMRMFITTEDLTMPDRGDIRGYFNGDIHAENRRNQDAHVIVHEFAHALHWYVGGHVRDMYHEDEELFGATADSFEVLGKLMVTEQCYGVEVLYP